MPHQRDHNYDIIAQHACSITTSQCEEEQEEEEEEEEEGCPNQ